MANRRRGKNARQERRVEAEERQGLRERRSPADQMGELDRRNARSLRERARLDTDHD